MSNSDIAQRCYWLCGKLLNIKFSNPNLTSLQGLGSSETQQVCLRPRVAEAWREEWGGKCFWQREPDGIFCVHCALPCKGSHRYIYTVLLDCVFIRLCGPTQTSAALELVPSLLTSCLGEGSSSILSHLGRHAVTLGFLTATLTLFRIQLVVWGCVSLLHP